MPGERPWEPRGPFLLRRGPAWVADRAAPCQKKLCYVATDRRLLVEILTELSDRPDCWMVKHSVEPRDAMYLGRCFLTDERAVGTVWDEHKRHPRLMCTIQDDDFAAPFRRD